MTSEYKKTIRFQSVLYTSNEFQLYIGQLKLVQNTPASLPELMAVALEGKIRMKLADDENIVLPSMFSHYAFQRRVSLDGIYAYLILSPGNRYSHVLRDRMEPVAQGLYSDVKNVDSFRDAFNKILLNRPPIENVKQQLDELIIGDDYRLYTDGAIDQRAQKVIQIINEQPKRNFSVEELAKEVYLSPSRLMGLFKKEARMTLGQYSAFRKLIYAYYLIGEGGTLANAAKTSGFYDDSHLAKTSRKFFGILPSLLFSAEVNTQVIGTQKF